MFRLVVVAELDLTLVASELAGFVKGDRMRSVQNVVPGLATNRDKTHQHAHANYSEYRSKHTGLGDVKHNHGSWWQ